MNDNTRKLSAKANAIDLEALTLLARMQGFIRGLNLTVADDGRVFWDGNTSKDTLLADIDAYVYAEGK